MAPAWHIVQSPASMHHSKHNGTMFHAGRRPLAPPVVANAPAIPSCTHMHTHGLYPPKLLTTVNCSSSPSFNGSARTHARKPGLAWIYQSSRNRTGK